jgi:signal transduction histidine kinase
MADTGPNPTNPLAELEARLRQLEACDLPPEARQHLDEALALLPEVKGEKAAFVSTVTHELRLPMTSILGYTDLLRQGMMGELNDNQRNFLEVIRDNVGRMSRLVSDISDLYKAESGRLVLEIAPTGVGDVVWEAVNRMDGLAAGRRQQVEVAAPDGLPAIQADPQRAVQMVRYLMENAILYSPEGSLIRVAAEEAGGLVRLSVTDQGIGIEPEDQAQIFTQFFRSEVEVVREHKGWGLSLCVVQALAGLHGGSVGFESEPGHGSTFWVVLPIAAAV